MEDKFKQLFDLGEATRSPKWPDYLQYGFDDQDTPGLIKLVLDMELHNAHSQSNDVWIPLHSWRTLGQIGSPKAVEPLVSMFDYLEKDDWALSELPIVMGMIGEESLDLLSEYLLQTDHPEFARVMAADGIKQVAIRYPGTKERVVSILSGYLENPDMKTTIFNAIVTGYLIDLNAIESIDIIRKLYAEGLADLAHCGDIEDIEIEFGIRLERSTPAKNNLFHDFDEPPPFMERATPKIGRNDPCPCGSGKKYKKCCLN